MNYSKPIHSWLVEPLSPLGLWLKITVILIVSIFIESKPTHPSWAISMILTAAFILVPLGFQQVMNRNGVFRVKFRGYTEGVLSWHLFATFLLSISFILEKSWIGGVLALPYTIWCAFIFLKIIQFNFKLPYLTTLATWGFLTNAAVWCVFDRLDYQPLGLTPWIVLLTGAHFHYAGFALTLSLSLLLNENPQNKITVIAAWGVLSGVMLTATGITTTQLGYSHFIETLAGVWMALAAFLVGLSFLLRGYFNEKTLRVRVLWMTGGSCLILGMTLAFFYALRHLIAIDWLTIPHMQAIHGSLNALGFGTLMLLGWAFKNKQNVL